MLKNQYLKPSTELRISREAMIPALVNKLVTWTLCSSQLEALVVVALTAKPGDIQAEQSTLYQCPRSGSHPQW